MATPPPPPSQNDSAYQIIHDALKTYGLGALSDWAWNLYKNNKVADWDSLKLQVYDRPEFKTRFPAFQALRDDGRAISVDDYRNYEQTIGRMVQGFGLPKEVYTSPTYIAKLLTHDVDPTEFQKRAQMAQAATTTVPVEVRSALQRFYNVAPGDLTSWFLETEQTQGLLEKRFASAQLAGEYRMQSLRDISEATASRMAEAGVSTETARQAFSHVGNLSGQLPGEAEGELGANVAALGAVGVGPEAERLARRRAQRGAAFAAGGTAVTGEGGATGLGTTAR